MTEYIGLIITLFLLSMICERLADFFKNYLGETSTGTGRAIGRLLNMGDLTTRNDPDSKEEDKRYYKILKINIWCGFFTAIALNADLFNIIKHGTEPFKAIGWYDTTKIWDKNFEWTWNLIPKSISFIVGCFATGFFISFGSKFWHDLLDIVYQVKNYRRILADPETYKIDNIQSFDKVISTYQSDFIKAAYLEAKTKYMAMDYVKAIAIKSNDLGYYFELTVSRNDPNIEQFYQYLLDDGTLHKIPIRIVILKPNDNIIAHNIDLSSRVFDITQPASFGTLGVIVRPLDNNSQTRYLLTCCHNVIKPLSKLPYVIPGSTVVTAGIQDDTNTTSRIGTVFQAERDFEMDAALVEIDPQIVPTIRNSIPQIGQPLQPRVLTNNDKNVTRAFMFGGKTGREKGFTEGTVTSVYSTIKITYNSVSEFTIINTIAISNNGRSISQSGDSGTCVVDDKSNVIGLVVAGNSEVTYVLPITTLLSKLKVQLA